MEQLYGIIQQDGTVLAEDGTIHNLPVRGEDKEGYKQVLIDAKIVGGNGRMSRQSIKPFIGMRVKFARVEYGYQGFNFEIVKQTL